MRVATADLDDAADISRPSTKNRRAALTHSRTERVLHALEERALFDRVAAGERVLLEQIALALVQLRRNDDVNGDVMIAALRSAHARHAVSAQPQPSFRIAFPAEASARRRRRATERRSSRRARLAGKLTGTSTNVSRPSRRKSGCGAMLK